MKREIETEEDLSLLMDRFYGKILKDNKLKVLFNIVIQDKWFRCQSKMFSLWQTIIYNDGPQFGNPLDHFVNLTLKKKHFERLIDLFYQALDENFLGENVDEFKWQAANLAEIYHYKLVQERWSRSKK